MLKTIAEHTIDTDLLDGGLCIDVGCRGFQFSEALRDLGCKVLAFDLEEMEAPEGITFYKKAIFTGEPNTLYYTDTADQQAKYISETGISIGSIGLAFLYEGLTNKNDVDVLKLDCEGSEYHILSDPDFQPIPKQISVEFHMHVHKDLHDKYFDRCIAQLKRDYVTVKMELTEAHGAGLNYWDCLFIKKIINV